MALIAGADGCSAGWLSIRRDTDTRALQADVHWSARALFEAHRQCAVLTIDIPIGLAETGPRECDVAARRLLGPVRASSVFPSPVRATLAASSWEEACALSEAACGKRLSKQTFAILERIRDVDALVRNGGARPAQVREVHPEVCFAFLNGGAPIIEPKRSPQGLGIRRALLEAVFGPVIDGLRQDIRRGAAADDDILDALVALWTAERILEGRAHTLPAEPLRDAFGLRMEMVA